MISRTFLDPNQNSKFTVTIVFNGKRLFFFKDKKHRNTNFYFHYIREQKLLQEQLRKNINKVN